MYLSRLHKKVKGGKSIFHEQLRFKVDPPALWAIVEPHDNP
jgi:hypothetical protein